MAKSKSTRPTSEQRGATEKRAKTRALLLRTALVCMREEGLAAASAATIANRCGLSWGVIQYHFGDRAGLLVAILEYSFDTLKEVLSDFETAPSGVPERVHALVDGMWSLMQTPLQAVHLEMLLEVGRDSEHSALVRQHMGQVREQLREVWRKALSELPAERVDRAERLATLSLMGMAMERVAVGPREAHRADFTGLVDTLVGMLEAGAREDEGDLRLRQNDA